MSRKQVKTVALQPIRSGGTTYMPGQTFVLDPEVAERLAAKGYVKLASSDKKKTPDEGEKTNEQEG